VFLAACSSDESTKLQTQIVAKVNGDVITADQLKTETQKIKNKVSDPVQLSQKLITGLIDRQLLVQESLKLGLDRTPEVQEAVASAKAQVYAQAYIAKKLAKLSPPNEQEVKQFVDGHPEYFSDRKMFNTVDIVFENNVDPLDLHWLESEVVTLDALRHVLDQKGIKYQTVNNRFSTDGLPQPLLDKIKQLKIGDLLFANDNNKVIVKAISSIEPYSVQASQAEQIAIRMLTEKRHQAFIEKEIDRLKALATIETFETHTTATDVEKVIVQKSK
jgi:EpsD family peptidyl-prolyl cis-trans isomerase